MGTTRQKHAGKRIAAIREAARLSQTALGELLGRRQATISAWERKPDPALTPDELAKLSDQFQESEDVLRYLVHGGKLPGIHVYSGPKRRRRRREERAKADSASPVAGTDDTPTPGEPIQFEEDKLTDPDEIWSRFAEYVSRVPPEVVRLMAAMHRSAKVPEPTAKGGDALSGTPFLGLTG